MDKQELKKLITKHRAYVNASKAKLAEVKRRKLEIEEEAARSRTVAY